MSVSFFVLFHESNLDIYLIIKLKVISSPFYACAKLMFTCVFTNKYSDTSFRIVSFSRFLFITCTRNKTFSQEIEECTRDIPAESDHSPNFPPFCSIKELFTLNMVLHVISYVKSSSAPSKTKMADHAQNGLEITFKVINFYSESCREMGCQGWGN